MEVPNEGVQLYISNLQLISPQRAAELGIESESPEFISHMANIFFRRLTRGFDQVDISRYRLELGKPMDAREWILRRGSLDESDFLFDLQFEPVPIPGGISGKWIGIVEDIGEAEGRKAGEIRVKEIRAYCGHGGIFHKDIQRLERGYLLYEPAGRVDASVYKAGAYAPVCSLEVHRNSFEISQHFLGRRRHSIPGYQFLIGEDGKVSFSPVSQ